MDVLNLDEPPPPRATLNKRASAKWAINGYCPKLAKYFAKKKPKKEKKSTSTNYIGEPSLRPGGIPQVYDFVKYRRIPPKYAITIATIVY